MQTAITQGNNCSAKDNRRELVLSIKIGIIKQLHKDNLITVMQYRSLLAKYGIKAG